MMRDSSFGSFITYSLVYSFLLQFLDFFRRNTCISCNLFCRQTAFFHVSCHGKCLIVFALLHTLLKPFLSACLSALVVSVLAGIAPGLRLVVEKHLVLELRFAELLVREEFFVVFFRFFYSDIGFFILFHKILLRAFDKKSEPAEQRWIELPSDGTVYSIQCIRV